MLVAKNTVPSRVEVLNLVLKVSIKRHTAAGYTFTQSVVSSHLKKVPRYFSKIGPSAKTAWSVQMPPPLMYEDGRG